MTFREDLIACLGRHASYRASVTVADDLTEKHSVELREEFLRLLTTDSETKDRRRREYNQSIFDGERGYAIWTGTDLPMVMEKFDQAVKNVDQART